MNLNTTSIAGLMRVEVASYLDQRGSLTRFYDQDALHELVGSRRILQVNHSLTHSVGAVRGCHYQQSPHLEIKMVRCLRGRAWDVVVDLRAGSSTFLAWHAEELSATNNIMMIIPEGCAHGFQVLQKDTELLYFHTASYSASAEGGVRPTDPILNIEWPLPMQDVSDRDRQHPLLTVEFTGLVV